LTREGLKLIKTAAYVCKIEAIWIGGKDATDIAYDLKIPLENVRVSSAFPALSRFPGCSS
jgi:hypothetical protein